MSVGRSIRTLLAALALVASAGAASAAVLPLQGAFGNAAGCAFFMSGVAGEDMLLLTPDSFASAGVTCDFEWLLSSNDVVFTIGGVCTGGIDQLSVVPQADGAYAVTVGDLPPLGPLAPCPGSSEILSPGVRT